MREIIVSSQAANPHDVLTKIMLTVFRVNARLLEKGDQLVAPLGLTSARWQVIGAIALAGQALTCPQIAVAMGVTRQGTQKQLNLAQQDRLIVAHANPRHERSPLYELTDEGRRLYDAAMVSQVVWAKALAKGVTPEVLETTLEVLNELDIRLQSTALPLSRVNP